jgi:hypothetical protein
MNGVRPDILTFDCALGMLGLNPLSSFYLLLAVLLLVRPFEEFLHRYRDEYSGWGP